MRSTNNTNTIDFDAEASEGNVFWVVYDPDTQETLMSMDFDSYKWKRISLCAGDSYGLSELDETARFPSYDEAEAVAQDAARVLTEEHPEEDISLEIHRVRLEMVEMVQDIDFAAGKVNRAGSSDEEEDEEDVTSEDEEEQADSTRVFGSQPFDPRGDLNRQRKIRERLDNTSSKKSKKVKPAKKKSAKSR